MKTVSEVRGKPLSLTNNLDTKLEFSRCLEVLCSAMVIQLQGPSSHQSSVKARNRKRRGEQEFETANLCGVIPCRCGYKSLKHFTKEYI